MSVTTRITDDDVGRGSAHGALLPLGLAPDDVNCPICVETISDPFVTSCGHTFCYQCISTHLRYKNSCPSCGDYLTADNIYPNFLLNKILRKAATAPPSGRCSLLDQVQRLLADDMAPPLDTRPPHQDTRAPATAAAATAAPYGAATAAAAPPPPFGALALSYGTGGGSRLPRLRLRDIDAVLEALYEAREELERRESSDVLHLLLAFLQHAKEHKARQMTELRRQLACLEHDIHRVMPPAAAAGALSTAVGGAVGAAAAADTGDAAAAAAGWGLRLGNGSSMDFTAEMEVQEEAHTRPDPPPHGPHQQQQHRAAVPAGAWVLRALPHLGADGAGGGADGDGVGEGTEPGLVEASPPPQALQRRRVAAQRAPPMRRASWCLHTITPDGGISSVTIDTSSLDEPGQQAEAFGAAVQHALAAARRSAGGGAAASASISMSAAEDSAVRRRLSDGDVEMDSVMQPPDVAEPAPAELWPEAAGGGAAAPGKCEGSGSAAAAVASAASRPVTTEVEMAAGQPAEGADTVAGSDTVAAARSGERRHVDAAEPTIAAAAAGLGRRGMPRCGSADNFMLLLGQAAITAAPSPEAAAEGSQPSASGEAGTSIAWGEDGSAASGAAFQPTRTASHGVVQAHQHPADDGMPRKASSAAAAKRAAEAVTAGVGAAATSHHGPGGGSISGRVLAPLVGRRGGEGGTPEEISEDEMDVRERRRGRGLPAASGRQQPPPRPPPHYQHQARVRPPLVATGNDSRVVSSAAAAAAASTAVRGGHEDAPGPGAVAAGALPQQQQQEGHDQDRDPAAVREAKRRRMLSQFELLARCYLQMRAAATAQQHHHSQQHHPHHQSVFQQHHHQQQHHHHQKRLGGMLAAPLPQPQFGSFQSIAAAVAGGACGGAHPHRGPSGPGGLCNCDSGDDGGGGGGDPDLDSFGAVLAAATQYSRLEVLAEIPRQGSGSGGGGGGGGLHILSSIEFDMSDDLFATAGVVPRILVYDYQALLSRQRPPRPVKELTARSKLSSLSYSRGARQHLLAADYLGGVALWDTEAGMQIQDYEAHERRVWGVDFSPAPGHHHCFASGSDDGLVKIWSTRQPSSCLALELRGNVCSVEYHPTHPHLLAVGSALHCAAVYDIRQPAAPLHTLLGHRRAVSYVRWLSDRPDELATASTDSTLKLWSLSPPPPPSQAPQPPQPPFAFATAAAAAAVPLSAGVAQPPFASSPAAASSFRGAQLIRTFTGHLNERNFVGLTASGAGDYLAAGSESHEVVLYHRSLPQPALRVGFGARMQQLERSSGAAGGAPGPGHPPPQPHLPSNQPQPQGGQPQPHPNHFVTALQWRHNSPHLLAANSAGHIWLLGLRL